MTSSLGQDLSFLTEPDAESAFGLFLSRYADVVYRAVGRAIPDEEGARDVAAEVLTRMRGTWPDPVGRFAERTDGRSCRFETWLAVVVRNLAIDVQRSWEGRRMLPRAVGRCPRWQQSMYQLVYWDGHSLSSAFETLRSRGEFHGTYGDLIEAANALHRVLPAASRLPRQPKPLSLDESRDDDSSGPRLTPETRAPSPEDLATARRASDALSAILDSLDQDQRLLLRLYFLEGMRADALVSLVGAASRTEVYNRVHGLLERLRRRVRELDLDVDDIAHLVDTPWADALTRSGETP